MGKYKKLLKRVDKIEKHLHLNTEVTVSKMESVELTELPEKWCIKVDVYNYKDLQKYTENIELNYGVYILSDGKKSYSLIKISPYTEITFEQFKKWVLKEDSKVVESDHLSIREVQVKVSTQEEANECAEIANECGEKVDFEAISFNSFYYFFRMRQTENNFCVCLESGKYTTISIQEYRERFGKPKKIDWLKVNYFQYINEFNPKDKIYCISQPENWCLDNERMKVIILSESEDKDRLGYTAFVIKSALKLCTEPITLKNE